MVKMTSVVLIAVLVALQYALWLGDKNIFDLYHLRQSVAETRVANANIQARNDQLLAEVIDLKSGGEAVETLVRKELGFIKKGETFYQVVE